MEKSGCHWPVSSSIYFFVGYNLRREGYYPLSLPRFSEAVWNIYNCGDNARNTFTGLIQSFAGAFTYVSPREGMRSKENREINWKRESVCRGIRKRRWEEETETLGKFSQNRRYVLNSVTRISKPHSSGSTKLDRNFSRILAITEKDEDKLQIESVGSLINETHTIWHVHFLTRDDSLGDTRALDLKWVFSNGDCFLWNCKFPSED